MAQPIQVFSRRYEIVRPVARGGMAQVHLAHDQLLDRPVALKVLSRELSSDPSFVERFRREAQSAANLTHPNIVSVYDFGEEDGTPFIVMEYVDGRTLTDIIRSEAPLAPERAAAIAADVAGALAFAHRNGVVHRDVKPGNVLIDRSGLVKVADFGIARAANTQENLTQTGAVMGTATYFSPEQAQGSAIDARTDVYSLGVVLYEMVTGRPPFAGESPVAIAYKHVREAPAAPRSLNPRIPEELEAIVLQALAKDRDDRYGTAEEFREDLVRFRQGRRVVASPPSAVVATGAAPTQAVPTVVDAPYRGDRTRVVSVDEVVPAPPPPPPPPSRAGPYVVLLIVMLAALAGLLFLLGRTLGIVGAPSATREVDVPSVIGEPAAQAERTLRELGLVVRQEQENNEADAGTVFDQDPAGGTRVEEGATVTIKVSRGEAPVAVPSVVGDDVDDAVDTLEGAGFEVRQTQQPDPQRPAGTVISQDPRAGTEAAKGSTVTLVVSSGKPKVGVPNVAGKETNDALVELQSAGLVVRTAFEPSDRVPEDRVTRTDPAAGTQVDQGTTVTVYVSSGREQVEVPDVVGLREDEARRELTAAGFQVRVQPQQVPSDDDDGRVIAQNPRAGTRAERGSTVTIAVGRRGLF